MSLTARELDDALAGIGLTRADIRMGRQAATTERGTAYVKIVNAYCPVAEAEYIPPTVTDGMDNAQSRANAIAKFVSGFNSYREEMGEPVTHTVWRSLPSLAEHEVSPGVLGFWVRARFAFEAP
jgi:hypothetical protein